ncbi:Gfo/Idh/MocA family protein [Marisediminicola senii]|uniref:Gfo/Idh/MocA family protein n=1 Tax=Marisediminicola senii TaxID=2711233 RepID=UPI0013EC08F3|nr:Gfo/Idh/MocA family oxidoreductase [Marisediminicola senii]
MPGTLRWGILGPGGIAASQTTDLLGDGFVVTAVGSRSLSSAREFADRFGIEKAYGSYDELVGDPDVDIIYVATPHSHHYAHARLALEAGKHVLVEKAFTVTQEQAAILAELAESKSLVVLEAMWTRYLPHMVRLREIVAAGTIGDVRSIVVDHTQKLSADPTSRLQDPALAGGALLDLGIYPVSFAWDILGEPTAIHASASFTATGVDRSTSVILDYEEGRQAILTTALDASGPNTATVQGTEGWIAIDRVWYNATSFTVYNSDGDVVDTYESDVKNRGMQYQAAEVERLVDARFTAGVILPPEESVRIMGTLDEIRRQIGLQYPAEILAV